jgi:hypothetical protein
MTEFETLQASALFFGPAAKGYRGVATVFDINGHRAALVAPDNATLRALCKQWGIEAPIANVAEPVVVVQRSIVKEEETDGLDDGLGDGL